MARPAIPWNQAFFLLEAAENALRKSNDKKTVVFLHGWGLDGDSFNSIIKRVEAISTVKIDNKSETVS